MTMGRVHVPAVLVLLICCIALCSSARTAPFSHLRKLSALVPEAPLVLPYHNGPLLSGDGILNVHLLWYGRFSASQRSTILDFLASFQSKEGQQPSLSSWWKITSGYKDSTGSPVFTTVQPGEQLMDAAYSLGKNMKRTDLQTLIGKAISSASFPLDSKALYLVLTSDDVYVDGFCMDLCASHTYANSTTMVNGERKLPIAWVGNSISTCAGKCAWPFANPKEFGGPDTPALVAPNGDAGIDGMIINIATVLAGAATNPFDTGYYQGSAEAPLEAATACTGIFGEGAYPGYAGELLVEKSTGASFNVHGVNNRAFLVPALWNPATLACYSPS
ncbi:hypothetical protein O6H91_07G092600 [Diphasiastrum complanatum]|uniref:Uncharacterized protein n=2 Tax=Diphasiastrum complanatum TaxID=34168 RepID=A0ACC2D6U3_DIPCM|nr:hypothetical protein O6H91_07G078700 [Diphasiastrum complanatum]KAJ7550287.1 hypothetical protein O6H91_07G092600 [Diphasiastrum complanatum]